MRCIDAHCHIWDLNRGDYDWLDVSKPEFHAIAQNFSLTDYQQAYREFSPERIVLIQAAATEAETAFLLKQSEKNPLVGAVVGWVDLADQRVEKSIVEFAQFPSFRGIRPMLQDIEQTDWLLKVPSYSTWELLAEHDLSLDALVTPRHLIMLNIFAKLHSNLRIVIDHAAKPQWASGQFNLAQYKKDIAAVAKNQNVYCKLSGIVTELSFRQRQQAQDFIQPVVDHLLTHFGTERLMWGSDWPVVNMAMSYPQWEQISQALFDHLDDSELQAIFYETAKKFYGIEGGDHDAIN